MNKPLNIAILGLSITSSWGNGHATIFRGLVKQLRRMGHHITFYERDKPWYRTNRDLPHSTDCDIILYDSLDDLRTHRNALARSDALIVGSYVPEGDAVARYAQEVGGGAILFYDIDTPITIAALQRGDCEYLDRSTVSGFDIYLSFTGGPLLDRLREQYGAQRAEPLYCCVDEEVYYPEPQAIAWDLGYLGTHSDDRQPGLERLLMQPARRLPDHAFVVAGPQYPADIIWPPNVHRIDHLPPAEHRSFYNRQRVTLNITRAEMRRVGYAPSVRLFEAAACGVPIVSDRWDGIDTFFRPDDQIMLVDETEDVVSLLQDTSPERLHAVGEAARQRVLAEHTAQQRALQLLQYIEQARTARPSPARRKQPLPLEALADDHHAS